MALLSLLTCRSEVEYLKCQLLQKTYANIHIYIYLSLNYIDGLTKTQIEHGGRKNRVNTTHDRFGSIEHPGGLALHGLSNSLV